MKTVAVVLWLVSCAGFGMLLVVGLSQQFSTVVFP